MRVLVTGASGLLGGYLLREFTRRGLPVVAWSGSRSGLLFGVPLRPVDLTAADQVSREFQAARPTLILHAAALAKIADCHQDPLRARWVNVQASARLAELADRARARLVLVSTDLVFDGQRGWYREEDEPAPLSVYGQTKVDAERAVLAFARHAVVRLSLLFGPTLEGRSSFFDGQISALRERKPCTLFADEWRTPLSLATAAEGLLALAESELTGLVHLGGPERLSRLEMGQRLATLLGHDPAVFTPATRESVPAAEPRPRDTSLDSSRWSGLFPGLPRPGFEEALRALLPS